MAVNSCVVDVAITVKDISLKNVVAVHSNGVVKYIAKFVQKKGLDIDVIEVLDKVYDTLVCLNSSDGNCNDSIYHHEWRTSENRKERI